MPRELAVQPISNGVLDTSGAPREQRWNAGGRGNENAASRWCENG